MARIARVLVPDLPHHVTQRGNRREPVVFAADDYRLYRRLVAAARRAYGCCASAGALHAAAHGSIRVRPQPSNPPASRVARPAPFARAIAAISASSPSIG